MSEYRVEWSFTGIEAKNIGDALEQAIEMLTAALDTRSGASGFIVTDESGNSELIDLEDWGFCDECSDLYILGSRDARCGECGYCTLHCTHMAP